MAYSTQPSIRHSNELFKQDLMTLATGIVWKNRTAAINNETDDTQELYRIELFVVANRGMLNWDVIRAFPRVVILNSGLNRERLEMYASDKKTIPENWRQILVDEYAKALTSKNPLTGRYAYYSKATDEWVTVYEETNNYYRMLMGLPDYAASSDMYVYNTDPRWPTDIPVHEMELLDRMDMEKAGVLNELIKANPDKPYLKYLGRKNVDFFKARIADRYEILWRDDSQSKSLNHDFDDVYEKSRQLFLAVYYNEEMRQTHNLYDSFMAMSILFMTLQQMQSYYLHVDITRDFYDLESLKVLYDAYSVPFYPEIPFEYHRKIVKNINKLISFKGSSQVFFDLFQIFDLGSMNIYHYYLTKRHKVDEYNQPLYRFKYDGDGNVMLDEKNRPIYDPSVYEMKFSKVLIGEDPALAIGDRANDVDYDLLTVTDPYWIEDNDLIRKLQNAKFNYLETKYIGIQTIFDLMSITFENAYIFRMITDNKEICEALSFRWTDLGIDCSLFDLFIYLAAIYCRLYGYEGLITNKIPAMMDTLGYNFEEARDILRNQVLTDPVLSQRQDIIDLMTDMDMETVDQANKVYENIQTIREIVMDGYQKAKTKQEFFAYRDLYDTLLTSKEVTAVYTNPKTGEIFETFTDVLANCSPELMQRYLLTDDEKITEEMSICIDKLEEVLSSMRWLPFSAGANSSKMIESLFRVLKFFKSAKAELIGYDITYAITLRGTNFFKNIGLIDRIFNNYWDNDKNTFMDFVELIHTLTKARYDAFKMLDVVTRDHETVFWWDYIKYLTDCIWVIHDVIEDIFKHETWYIDFVQVVSSTAMLKSKQLMDDCTMAEEITWDILEPRYFGLIKDEIRYLIDKLKFGDYRSYCMSLLYDIDFVHYIYTTYYLQKDPRFRTGITYGDKVLASDMVHYLDPDKQLFREAYEITRQLYTESDIQTYTDLLEGHHFMESFDKIDLKDRLARILAAWYVDDKLVSLTDLVKLIILVSRHHDLHELTDRIFEMVKVTTRSDTWAVDIVEEMKEFAELVDSQVFEDSVTTETILYEIFWPHFSDKLDSDIHRYADKLKDVGYENNCKIQVMDLLYLIDDIAVGKVTVNLDRANLSAISVNIDGLRIKANQSYPDSKMLFSEFLGVIESLKQPDDDTEFTDHLIGNLQGNVSDEAAIEDSFARLIASYLIDEKLTLNDFVRMVLSIESVKDRSHLIDTITAKLTEYSDKDYTFLADLVNTTVFNYGHVLDVQGFEDFLEKEDIFYDDIGIVIRDFIKDKIETLTDQLRSVSDGERNRTRILDTMVLINGLSKILAVHEENHFSMFATIRFTDYFRENGTKPSVQKPRDVSTLKDLITYIDSKYLESKSTMDDFDNIWQKSEHYGFSVNEARDHLINIMAMLHGSDELNLVDMLHCVIILSQIKDNPDAVDMLYREMSTVFASATNKEDVDFIKCLDKIAIISTAGMCDDSTKAQQILFDQIQVAESEQWAVKDCVYELSDDIDHIDINAMLMRELMALVDSLSTNELDIPLVDITETKDEISLARFQSRVESSESFEDIIDAVWEFGGFSSSIVQDEELSTEYQMDLHDQYAVTDLIASIVAICNREKSDAFFKDVLAMIYEVAKAKDYQALLDDIVTNTAGSFGSFSCEFDIIERSVYRGKIDDIFMLEDSVQAETILYEILQQEYSDFIKDAIYRIEDKLRRIGGTTIFRTATMIHFVDALVKGSFTINTKASEFTSFLDSDDEFFATEGKIRVHSDTFYKDYFKRSEEILSANDCAENRDLLSTTDQLVTTDRMAFMSSLYKIAAASYHYDKEYFNDLMKFCKMYAMLSDNSKFMDFLKQTMSSFIYDISNPIDTIRFIKTVSKFTDTQSYGDSVVSESIIFDDYEPTEIEFIEDIITSLTDKFATLSKHECKVLLDYNTMRVLDSLTTGKVKIRVPNTVIEFTDTLEQRTTKSRMRDIAALHEIFYEVAKSYSVFDKDVFIDMLQPTYFANTADRWETSDELIGVLGSYLEDESANKDFIRDRNTVYGMKSELDPIDKLLQSEEVSSHKDLVEIITQIRRIINIRYMASEQIITDIMYGKYFDKYSDKKILEDRINQVYQELDMQKEIDTLKDMLSRIEDSQSIETLQQYIDVLKMTFEAREFDHEALLDEIQKLSGSMHGFDNSTAHDVIKNIFKAALAEKIDVKEQLRITFSSIYKDAQNYMDNVMQTARSMLSDDFTITEEFVAVLITIAANDSVKTKDELTWYYRVGGKSEIKMLDKLLKTCDSQTLGRSTTVYEDVIYTVLRTAAKDTSILKDVIESVYEMVTYEQMSTDDFIHEVSGVASTKEVEYFDDILLKTVMSIAVKDPSLLKDTLAEKLVKLSALDTNVLHDLIMMAFNTTHLDKMPTEDSLSQSTEYKPIDESTLNDSIVELILGASLGDSAKLKDSILGAFRAEEFDYYRLYDSLMGAFSSYMKDITVTDDGVIKTVLTAILKDPMKFKDTLQAMIEAKYLDDMKLSDTISEIYQSTKSKDDSVVTDVLTQVVESKELDFHMAADELLIKVVLAAITSDDSVMKDALSQMSVWKDSDTALTDDKIKSTSEGHVSDLTVDTDNVIRVILRVMDKDSSILNDALIGASESIHHDGFTSSDSISGSFTGNLDDISSAKDDLIKMLLRVSVKESSILTDMLTTAIKAVHDDEMTYLDRLIQGTETSKVTDTTGTSDTLEASGGLNRADDTTILADEIIKILIGVNVKDLSKLKDRIVSSLKVIHADTIGTKDDLSQETVGHLADATSVNDFIFRSILNASVRDTAALTDAINGAFGFRKSDTAKQVDSMKQSTSTGSIKDDSSNIDDIIAAIIEAAAKDAIETNDEITGSFIDEHADLSEIIDMISKAAITMTDKDHTAAIDKIIVTLLSSNSKDATLLKDALTSAFESIYDDKATASDTIQGYQTSSDSDSSKVDDDLIKHVLNATMDDLVIVWDKLMTTFNAIYLDNSGMVESLKPYEEYTREDFNELYESIKSSQTSTTKETSALTDVIRGIVISEPDDFLKFIERYTLAETRDIEKDLLHCVSAIVSESGASKVSEIHDYLDTLYTSYAAKYGYKWIIKDTLSHGHMDFTVSDAFNTSDILKDGQNRSFANEIHKFIDMIVVSYYAQIKSIITMRDTIKATEYGIVGDAIHVMDRLISIIVDNITDMQIYLDLIIANYKESLIDSKYMHDLIRFNTELARIGKDDESPLDLFVKYDAEIRALDRSYFDESLALKEERQFLSSLNQYLDLIKTVYNTYGFDHRVFNDAVNYSNSGSYIGDKKVNLDDIPRFNLIWSGENIIGYVDTSIYESLSKGEDVSKVKDSTKEYVEKLFAALERIPTQDNLLQKRIRYLMSELGYSTDSIVGGSTSHVGDNSSTKDNMKHETSLNIGPGDVGMSSDDLTGEFHDKPVDHSAMSPVLYYTEDLNAIISPDRQSFKEAIMSMMLRFSLEDHFDLLTDKLDIKKITVKPEDIAAALDDFSQNGLLQDTSDYHKLSDLLGRLSERCNISKSSTIHAILDELCNQRLVFRIRTVVESYKDILKVNSEVPDTIKDELNLLDKLYSEAIQVIAHNLSLMSDISMEDAFSILETTPSQLKDSYGHTDNVTSSSETEDKDEHSISDRFSSSQGGMESDISKLSEEIHTINQQLRILTIVGRFAEVLTLTNEKYHPRDVAASFTGLAFIENSIKDPLEEGQTLADILLGQNQIVLCHPLKMKDGLYEFTPTGLRRVY